jgi:hypothetical protein
VTETVPSGDKDFYCSGSQNSVVVVVVVVSFSGNNTIFTAVSYTKLVV